MAVDIKVTIKNLYFFIPNLIPSVENQLMFNEGTQNIYEISYAENYAARRLISDMIVQVYMGSAQQVSSPKYLIGAHQTRDTIENPNKKINNAILDKLNLHK